MPEIWIPYGHVETLLTIQAENLGAVAEPAEESNADEVERLADRARRAAYVFVCDSKPATVQILSELSGTIEPGGGPKIFAFDARKVESLVPALKGRLASASGAEAAGENEPAYSPDLRGQGSKVFVATAHPDPLFGLVDAKVSASLNWVRNSKRLAAQKARDFAPRPFEETEAYDEAKRLVEGIPDASFATAVPRAGKVRSVAIDAPFEAIRNGFFTASLPQARALVVGVGGAGYDDSLSAALRSVWGVLNCVKKSGEILLIAECAEGLGSKALEMMVADRLGGDPARKKEKYIDGLEEVTYLNLLKTDYDVLLLSGMPELYARTKLGLSSARGAGEALGRLLNKLGRTTKVNVVTRASDCRIT